MRILLSLLFSGFGGVLFSGNGYCCCCLPGVWVCWISQMHSTYCIYPELHSVRFWAVIRLVLMARGAVGYGDGR